MPLYILFHSAAVSCDSWSYSPDSAATRSHTQHSCTRQKSLSAHHIAQLNRQGASSVLTALNQSMRVPECTALPLTDRGIEGEAGVAVSILQRVGSKVLACGPHLQGQLHPLNRLLLLVKELFCSGTGMTILKFQDFSQDQLAAVPSLQSASTLPPVGVSQYTSDSMCRADKHFLPLFAAQALAELASLQHSLPQDVLVTSSKKPQAEQCVTSSHLAAAFATGAPQLTFSHAFSMYASWWQCTQ